MRRRRALGSLIAVFAFALTTLASTRASRADAAELTDFTGTWIYADGRRGMRMIESAVERAIARMPFYVVPFAREMVRGRTIHFREVRLEVQGSTVRFGTETWGPVATRLGAHPVAIRAPEGTHLHLSQRVDHAGRLVQLFAHPDGARENTFSLSGDREWLWLSVRIYSPRLPDECRYRLRYRRADRSEPYASR